MKGFLLFALGLILGSLITIKAQDRYLHSDSRQVQACIEAYEHVDFNNPELQEVMKKEGFKTIHELIKDRCEHWVRAGQTFTNP